jgi:tRNA A-37 threonylcarbamoyl transferase component Bud32
VNQVGRFQILEELGRGACGVVYRALDPAIGRTVAIKSIRLSELSGPDERQDIRERLLREAQSAGKLSHPNIVTIYDVLEGNDLAYIFMEFVDGPSLKEAMRRPETPSREQVLSFLRQIAAALDYAHRKGIIHRDIKPANIMISDRGADRDAIAKIADFGVAKLISHEATHQRALMGTPSYMSPEQLEGVAVGGASDQFALGVVVYELLTGEKPFAAENLAALHYLICKRPAKPVNELNPALNETVNRLMERALSKLPEERYPSCSEFIGALSVALGECTEWRPVPSRKAEELEKAAGNGWYAPETVVSASLIEGEAGAEPVAIDPVVLPPVSDPFDTTALTRRADESTVEEFESKPETMTRRRVDGTRVVIGVERPAARRLSVLMAVCAALALLGILWLRFLSGPRANTQDLDPRNAVSIAPPEDLSAPATPPGTPADLTTAPVATPIATDPHASRTTVAVHTPAVRQAQIQTPAHETPLPQKEKQQTIPVTPAGAGTVFDVEIVSDPPGARAVIDSRSEASCLTPCSLPLAAGRHTLFAELSSYGTARKIFNVPTEGSVFVSLEGNMGMLLLTSEPAGSRVLVDGNDLGPTPVKVKLPAGRHHLSLSDGIRHHDETIEITVDGVYARTFRW